MRKAHRLRRRGDGLKGGHVIVLLIDWPERAVPEGLARAGREVWVKGGPGDDGYSLWPDGEKGVAPERADMVYVFRPLAEMPAAVGLAKRLSARTIWYQSGRNAAGDRDLKGCALSAGEAERLERLVAAAGMTLVWDRYVLEG